MKKGEDSTKKSAEASKKSSDSPKKGEDSMKKSGDSPKKSGEPEKKAEAKDGQKAASAVSAPAGPAFAQSPEEAVREAAAQLAKINFRDPAYYRNRELSWLAFDERCLSEARDKQIVPLFERMKFLSITASNLDEFTMVRVASLKDQVHAGYTRRDIAGMTAAEQVAAINEKMHEFVREQYNTANRQLIPAFEKAGLHLVRSYEDLTEKQEKYLDRYFEDNIYPILTPMALDSSRPFPLVRNKTLNIGALIAAKDDSGKKKDQIEFATVQVPSVIPRHVVLPEGEGGEKCVILLEEVIRKYIGQLFQHYNVLCAYPYRIMRNAELDVDEEEAEDLLKEIEKQLKRRQWGEVIRLEVEEGIDERLLKILVKELGVSGEDIFYINGPLDLTFLMKIYGLPGFEMYKEPKYVPAPVQAFAEAEDVFAAIRKGDILVHHPYMSFDPVVKFVQRAAVDPEVLAIKQTLYRVSGDSPIVAALARAAESGKQVTVLVELKARFDEENNIVWAKMLEKAGCHVIYGLLGLKTHSKITMVIRQEDDGIRRYVHLGTGNYNDSTAKLYTDCGLFTCDARIGADATAVFNMLSGYSEPEKWHRLLVAPIWMKKAFLRMIARERDNALAGKNAFIKAKMNSLCDPDIIAALYEASAAGVEISLLVRGICCLKVGIPGVSENIHVRSIVGNFLEHARIFWFCNDDEDELYMGSADWMPRNLDKRVEIVFPVDNEELAEELKHILTVEFEDNVKAHILQPDGTYVKIDKRGKKLVNSQEIFCQEAWEKVPTPPKVTESRRFIPAEPPVHEEEEE
ncbi:MAG: RNA degradosome polyphosphate kinase [Lachnospiraceae bacterium]